MGQAAEVRDVVGAFDFLSEVPDWTPSRLALMYSTLETHPIASGVIGIKLEAAGSTYLVLNAFYPEIEERFSRHSSSLLVMACSASTAWHQLRNRMVGATNPQRAVPGSVRASLLRDRVRLGLSEVSAQYNGFHISGGPIEGMAELSRLFSVVEDLPLVRTLFGSVLVQEFGFSPKELTTVSGNPVVIAEDREVPLFDLTEGLDTEEAAILAAREVRHQG